MAGELVSWSRDPMLSTCTTSVSLCHELVSTAKLYFTDSRWVILTEFSFSLDFWTSGPTADIMMYVSTQFLPWMVQTISSRIHNSSGEHSRCTRSHLWCRMEVMAGCCSYSLQSHVVLSCSELTPPGLGCALEAWAKTAWLQGLPTWLSEMQYSLSTACQDLC